MAASSNQTVNQIKVWLFPTLIGIIATIIWNDVKEIKSDVKLLMAQSNIDKTRIDHLEKQLEKLQKSDGTKLTDSDHGKSSDDSGKNGFVFNKDLFVDNRQKKNIVYYARKKKTFPRA